MMVARRVSKHNNPSYTSEWDECLILSLYTNETVVQKARSERRYSGVLKTQQDRWIMHACYLRILNQYYRILKS